MIQQRQKGVIKTLRFQLHQKQNILGLCHYCKTPGHLRKDCYKLSAPGTFSPLADLVPKEPQGLTPMTYNTSGKPLSRSGMNLHLSL